MQRARFFGPLLKVREHHSDPYECCDVRINRYDLDAFFSSDLDAPGCAHELKCGSGRGEHGFS